MHRPGTNHRSYLLAALLGAVGGGILVAFATRAVPRILQQAMSGMMQTMMERMSAGECSPSEM